MKEHLKLCELVELALGCPENGAVNFGVLKELLFGILSSTNTSEFIVYSSDKEKKITTQKNLDSNENEIEDKETLKLKEEHESLRPKKSESQDSWEGRESGEKEIEEDANNSSVIKSWNAVQNENENQQKFHAELKNLKDRVDSVSKFNEDIIRRLKIIERENGVGIFESMPNGKDLLAVKKEGKGIKNLQDGSVMTEDDHLKYASMGTAPDDLKMNVLESNMQGTSKFLINTWQNVKVNKRLQTVEDGMEKLFSMLDILTDEQQKLSFMVKDRGLKPDEVDCKIKGDKDINESDGNEIDADRLKNSEDKIKHMEDQLRNFIEGSNVRFKGDIGKLTEDISQLEKRLVDLETRKKESPGNAKDLNGDLQKLKESLKFDVDHVKDILNGVVLREELVEFVKWADLENALNVREFKMAQNAQGLSNEVKDEKDSERRDQENLISFENEVDQQPSGNDQKAFTDSLPTNSEEKPNNLNYSEVKHPSEEMKECLRRISNVAMLYEGLESKIDKIASEQENLAGKSKRDDENLESILTDMKDRIGSTTHIAECNKSLIDTARQEIDSLIKNQQDSLKASLSDNDVIDLLKGKMLDLEDKSNETVMAMNQWSNNIQSELRAKQQLIDALYECVEQLQRNKADVTNATSIFDLEAYKNALDTKVSMSEFDETMANLESNLRDVIDRIEQYTNEEEGLKNALAKISEDMRDKLDAKAGESLKKYLESRIAQLQKSRENLASRAGKDFLSNAAGVRRPLASLFHCISCDRPVNIPGMPLPTISQRFPKKNNRAQFFHEKPELSFGKDSSFNSQMDEIGNDNMKGNLELWGDPLATNRPCGGSHTAFPYAVKKPGKNLVWNQSNSLAEAKKLKKIIAENYTREKSIVDLLLGTDGHVYRGRYKKNELSKNMSSSFDRRGLRSRSAEVPRPSIGSTWRNHQSSSVPNSELSSPRSLPPLFKENGLVNTPAASMATNRSKPNLKSGPRQENL